MSEAEQLKELHRLLTTPGYELTVTRMLAIGMSIALVAVVLWLVRTRRLREEYTPIWMIAALALAIMSLRFDILYLVTRAIGAWTASSALFFLGDVFLTVVCLNYAVRLSRTGLQVKNLAQEVALLRADLEEMRRGAG